MNVGDIVGQTVQDGVLMFKIFNGYHHGQPVYRYAPVSNMTPKNAS